MARRSRNKPTDEPVTDERLRLTNLLEAAKARPITIDGPDPATGRATILGGAHAVRHVRRLLGILDGADGTMPETDDERIEREHAEAEADRQKRRGDLLVRLATADAVLVEAVKAAREAHAVMVTAVGRGEPGHAEWLEYARKVDAAHRARNDAATISADARRHNLPGHDDQPIPPRPATPPAPRTFSAEVDAILDNLARQADR